MEADGGEWGASISGGALQTIFLLGGFSMLLIRRNAHTAGRTCLVED